jgi:hypothetical protein
MLYLVIILALFLLITRHFYHRWSFPFSDPCGLIAIARVLQEKKISAINYTRPIATVANFASAKLDYLVDKTYFLYPLLLSKFPSRDPLILNRAAVWASMISGAGFALSWLAIFYNLSFYAEGYSIPLALAYFAILLHPGFIQMAVNARTDLPALFISSLHLLLFTSGSEFIEPKIIALIFGISGAFAYLLRTHAFVLVLTDFIIISIQIALKNWEVSSLFWFIFGTAIPLLIFWRASLDAVIFYFKYFFSNRNKNSEKGFDVHNTHQELKYSNIMWLNIAWHAFKGFKDFFDFSNSKRSIFGLSGIFGVLSIFAIFYPSLWLWEYSYIGKLSQFLIIFFFIQTLSLLLVSMIGATSQFAARENIPALAPTIALSLLLCLKFNSTFCWLLYYLGFIHLTWIYARIHIDLSIKNLTHHFSFWNARFEDTGHIRLENCLNSDKEIRWWAGRAKDISWRAPDKLFLRASNMYVWSKSSIERALQMYQTKRMIIEPYDLSLGPSVDPDGILYRLYYKLPVSINNFELTLLHEFGDCSKRLLVYGVKSKL